MSIDDEDHSTSRIGSDSNTAIGTGNTPSPADDFRSRSAFHKTTKTTRDVATAKHVDVAAKGSSVTGGTSSYMANGMNDSSRDDADLEVERGLKPTAVERVTGEKQAFLPTIVDRCSTYVDILLPPPKACSTPEPKLDDNDALLLSNTNVATKPTTHGEGPKHQMFMNQDIRLATLMIITV